MMTRYSFLFLCAWLVACGTSAPNETPETSAENTSGAEQPTLSWDTAGRDDLVQLVESSSLARIRALDPNLAIDDLDSWLADPTQAPSLGDRVCEQLTHLAVTAAAQNTPERAIQLIELIRSRARNRNQAYVGNTLLSEMTRRQAEASESTDSTEAVRAVLDALPQNRFGGATVVFQLFQNVGQVTARLEQLHQQLLSLDTAVSALFYEYVLTPIVEHRDTFMTAISQIRAAREGEAEPDPYAFSTVDLNNASDAQPILVAVWDTGVAGNLFENQLYRSTSETANGQDDDGNGLIDDIHGVIGDPTPGQDDLTYNPSPETISEYAPFLRGIMDLRAGLASSEAAQNVLRLMGSVQDATALEALGQNLDQIGEWAHGTHVAGIMLAGVPQAQVAVFRSAWAGEARLYHHRGPSDEELQAERQNVENIARFINAHQVRVVNASLGFGLDYIESELRHEADQYPTEEAVRTRAEEVHRHRRENWSWIFEHCPNTLFVIAAGNSNRDIVEYGDVPSSLEYANVMTIGAVDRFGNWATFTNSNPERVRVFDHGVEVDSVIPNGNRVPLSGTSMASPNVANLATKMLSVNPALTPSEVIAIIESTGTAIAAPFNGAIAHEERAINEARTRRTP